jgi:hypothetical protein
VGGVRNPSPGVQVFDEGVAVGFVPAIDFRGAGVAAIVSTGKAEVSIAGGGGMTTMKTTVDQAVSLAARTSITGFGFAVASVTDNAFRYHIIFRTQASTTGYRFGMDGPAGSVFEYLVHYQTIANATVGADVTMRKDVASFAMAALTSTPVTSVDDLLCTIEGTIRVSATAGAIDVVAATEVAGSNLTIKKGSWGFRF